jgi:hypothetical protein
MTVPQRVRTPRGVVGLCMPRPRRSVPLVGCGVGKCDLDQGGDPSIGGPPDPRSVRFPLLHFNLTIHFPPVHH